MNLSLLRFKVKKKLLNRSSKSDRTKHEEGTSQIWSNPKQTKTYNYVNINVMTIYSIMYN